jgi:Zn-dependent alcohol dehydrogenase
MLLRTTRSSVSNQRRVCLHCFSGCAQVRGDHQSGTYYGSVRPDIDFPILADLDMDKRLNLGGLISRTYRFDEINEGFRLMVSGFVARGVIVFD